MKTLFKLFINHGNHDDSFVEVIIQICMVFGYDLLCDLLEMLNLINIGSAVATVAAQKPSRSNSANEYERPDGREV
jgi:hypothetical protein